MPARIPVDIVIESILELETPIWTPVATYVTPAAIVVQGYKYYYGLRVDLDYIFTDDGFGDTEYTVNGLVTVEAVSGTLTDAKSFVSHRSSGVAVPLPCRHTTPNRKAGILLPTNSIDVMVYLNISKLPPDYARLSIQAIMGN